MKSIVLAALSAGVFALALAQPALANSKTEMCGFVDTIATDGVDAAIKYLDSIASHWGDDQRAKLSVVVGTELGKFDYKGGQVYQIAELPGAVEEYLLTLNLTSVGSVYVRVLYEGSGGDTLFYNIDFNSDYYAVIATPLMQTPKPVNCAKN